MKFENVELPSGWLIETSHYGTTEHRSQLANRNEAIKQLRLLVADQGCV